MINQYWEQSQQNKIVFVLVDSNGSEVSGLGTTFILELSKNGGVFVVGGGTKAEISNGWYSYLSTALEADTPGPVAIKVTHANIIQQNLEYVVKARNVFAEDRTYTVVESDGTPIQGVHVDISTDLAGLNVIWSGDTDTFGILRDDFDNKPRLDSGTYYFWRSRTGYSFDNPDSEVFV